jgi:hypothetical protein
VGVAIVLLFALEVTFINSRASWPHKLIVSVKSEKGYHYTPQSDFHVSVDQLASLLVEVQSHKNEDDRYRMLLRAACAARLGRHFYNDLFIVVALYIKNSGTVKRYFVFQPDSADSRVCTFESKQSCVFSLRSGFLCRGRPKLDATVRVVYCYIRALQPGIGDKK